MVSWWYYSSSLPSTSVELQPSLGEHRQDLCSSRLHLAPPGLEAGHQVPRVHRLQEQPHLLDAPGGVEGVAQAHQAPVDTLVLGEVEEDGGDEGAGEEDGGVHGGGGEEGSGEVGEEGGEGGLQGGGGGGGEGGARGDQVRQSLAGEHGA